MLTTLCFGLATLSSIGIGISSANAAMTAEDCQKRYASLDTANHGYVLENEAPSYFAFYRMGNKQVADGKLAKEAFLKDCIAGYYETAKLDEGAPLSGANSFTETQAKDRILSHGGSDVSPLK